MPFFSWLPENAGVRHVMLHQPRRYLPVCGTFTQEIMRGPSALSVAERELIAAYVSALNACHYCSGAHKAFALDSGVAEAVFDALVQQGPEAAPVDAKLRPILAYAKKLTQTPSRLTQGDADAVVAAGWPEQALSDAVAVVALFNFYNRLVDGHGVRGDTQTWARSTVAIREAGYEQFLKEAAEKAETSG